MKEYKKFSIKEEYVINHQYSVKSTLGITIHDYYKTSIELHINNI